jgi:hypothetical protein
MEEATIRAALRRHWEYAAADQDISHELYHDDAILEFPQSQERFEGKANFLTWRKRYPAALEFKLRRIRGRGDLWVAELSLRYDGGPWHYGCSILEFRGPKSPAKPSMSPKAGRLPTGVRRGAHRGRSSRWMDNVINFW